MDKNLSLILKQEYDGIGRIVAEERALVVYADDDTLWKILEDFRDQFNMEFEAGAREEHFIRIIN